MQRVYEKKLFDLLSETNYFLIPSYQREYSWNDEKIELIIEPLLSMNNNSMFSGNIILKNSGEVDIIDGQQRLTTYILIILVLFFNDYFLDDFKEESENIFNKIITKKILQFFHEKDVNSFNKIIDYVLENKEVKNKSQLPKKTLMEKAFLTINKKINKENAKEIINNLKLLFFSVFYVNTEDEAIETFVIMNTRGQQLKKWDVVKSKFILNANENDKDKTVNNWTKIDEYLSYDISRREYFLLFFLNSKLKENISQKEIISKFNDLIKENDLLNLEEEMICYAEILSKIYSPTKEYWKSIYENVYDISHFSFKQLFPIIAIIKLKMENANELDSNKYEDMLYNLFLYLIRTSTISNVYGTEPRQLIIKIKENLFSKNNQFDYQKYSLFLATNPKKIIELINNKSFEIPTDEKLAKWILRKFYISKIKLGKDVIYNKTLLFDTFENVTLEHIIDKSINKNFFDGFENKEYLLKEWYVEEKNNIPLEIYSLGNFTLLHRNENTMLGTKAWKKLERKFDFFWGSGYDTRHLLNLEDENFGFKNKPNLLDRSLVKSRAKYLIEEITKINIFKYTFETEN